MQFIFLPNTPHTNTPHTNVYTKLYTILHIHHTHTTLTPDHKYTHIYYV